MGSRGREGGRDEGSGSMHCVRDSQHCVRVSQHCVLDKVGEAAYRQTLRTSTLRKGQSKHWVRDRRRERLHTVPAARASQLPPHTPREHLPIRVIIHSRTYHSEGKFILRTNVGRK